jgi:hypothetical protein
MRYFIDRKIILFIFTLLCFNSLYSQDTFEVRGIVKDSISKKPLISSTVYLERLKDSSMISYSITDEKGFFKIEGSTKDLVLSLNVSNVKMKSYRRKIKFNKEVIDLGTIYLEPITRQLKEVMIKADRSPIVFKKDTLEFNASSFKTRDGANLEQLLEKLPGLRVDSYGNITVNGQPVQKILVNGKSFFGDDPKIALKNLPKSLIEKIQIVDTKTREQEFTGEESDSDDKTINVTIDEDKNKGIFSRFTLGGGTDQRYAMSGFGNYFKDDTRISIIAGSNNINSSGFSFDEVFDMMGSARRASRTLNGNSNGITNSDNLGISYADKWSKNNELESDYFYGANTSENETSIRRENILPDRIFFTNSENRSINRSASHRGNMEYALKLDTLTRISFRPNINITSGNREVISSSESLDNDGNPINQLNTENISEFDNTTFTNRLSLLRKLKTNGAYAVLRIGNTNIDSENNSVFNSSREIFGQNPNIELQNQNIQNDSQSDEYSVFTSYRNLLFDNFFYTLRYRYISENAKSERNVFDFDQDTELYTNFNQDLSNAFNLRSNKHVPKAGIRYDNDTLTISLNGGVNRTELSTKNLIQEINYDNDFNIFAYNGSMGYRFKDKSKLSFYFENSTQIPQVNQLQPVTIQTNPLNITVGNPRLDASVLHNFTLIYRKYDYKTSSGYGLYANYNYNKNQVVPVTTTDDDLVRRTTYTNLSGGQSATLNVYFNKNLRNTTKQNDKESFSFRGNVRLNYNKDLGFSNEQRFRSEAYSISPNLSFDYEIESLIDIEPRFGVTHNITSYNLQQNFNEEFTNLDFGLQFTSYWPKNLVFGNDINYTRFGNVSSDFDSDFWLWNISLGYTFAKDKAIVKFKVFDVLDQNIDTRRQTGDDFIQDTSQLILEQYFMLSFTYKFSKFGGKSPKSNRRYR